MLFSLFVELLNVMAEPKELSPTFAEIVYVPFDLPVIFIAVIVAEAGIEVLDNVIVPLNSLLLEAPSCAHELEPA